MGQHEDNFGSGFLWPVLAHRADNASIREGFNAAQIGGRY